MRFFDFIVLLFPLMIAYLAYRKKSLNGAGAIAAFVLSSVLYLSGGIRFLFVLLTFFMSSTLFTRYKGSEKKPLEDELYEKTSTRDMVQVFANGGAALIGAFLYLAEPREIYAIAVFAAFAACNADTWASEIGILSKRTPISIVTFKPIQKGMSGGISLLGIVASMGGSFLIAIFYLVLYPAGVSFGTVLLRVAIITVAGFMGSIVDSILGAVLQPAYLNEQTGRLTEKRYSQLSKNKKLKGFEWLNNDMVNFISSSLAAATVVFLK